MYSFAEELTKEDYDLIEKVYKAVSLKPSLFVNFMYACYGAFNKRVEFAEKRAEDDNCDCAYIWKSEKGKRPDFLNDILPCGHSIGMICFSASNMKQGNTAMDMVDYLIKNHMIKYSAYHKIKELGGELSDSLNCRVPVRNLEEDELEDMDWE